MPTATNASAAAAASEARLPEAVGNDRRLAPARHEFFWKESTPDEWLHPERVEESLGHLPAKQHLWIAAPRIVVRVRNRCGYRRKGLAAAAPVEEVRRRNVLAHGRRRGVPRPDGNDALGIVVRQRAEHQRIQEGHDRHGAADPESQDEDRGKREARRFPEHTRRVTQVVNGIRISRELAAEPRGIWKRPKGSTQEVHASAPILFGFERVPAVSHFSFPLGSPVRSPARWDDG